MSGQMAELIIYFKARLVYLKLFSHMQCSLEFLPKGTCKDLLVRLSGTLNSFSLMQSLRDVWLSSCASRKTNRPANSWFRESSCSASLSLNTDSSPALTKPSISRSEKETDCLLLCSTKEKEHFWIIIWPDSPNIVQTCENRIFDYFVYWLWICAAVSQMKKIK